MRPASFDCSVWPSLSNSPNSDHPSHPADRAIRFHAPKEFGIPFYSTLFKPIRCYRITGIGEYRHKIGSISGTNDFIGIGETAVSQWGLHSVARSNAGFFRHANLWILQSIEAAIHVVPEGIQQIISIVRETPRQPERLLS